jgi:hypothetical protein
MRKNIRSGGCFWWPGLASIIVGEIKTPLRGERVFIPLARGIVD